MVFNREEAARRAEASHTNAPGTCQLWTRTMFGVDSAGDRDRDGDSDAVDGWKSEPLAHRHTDRNPPRGVPVAWSGGRSGYGHRAVSLGHGKIRSTDAGGSGKVATVDLDWVERNWGLTYLGWSNTMTGVLIPVPAPPGPRTRGEKVDAALKKLRIAKKREPDGTRRDVLLDRAIFVLERIPFISRRVK